LIDPKDNVVISLSQIEANESFFVKSNNSETEFISKQPVPFGHKIAISSIPTGGKIIKYGKEIGYATNDIHIGDWVHTHNVKDNYEVK
jgi:altronate dehydratase